MRWPGVVDRAQLQDFLLGYWSGQLGLLMVPDTLLITWSQPAGEKDRERKRERERADQRLPVFPPWKVIKINKNKSVSSSKH